MLLRERALPPSAGGRGDAGVTRMCEPTPDPTHDADGHPYGRHIAESVSDELQRAAAAITERLLTQLLSRAFSPRIKLLDIDQVCEALNLSRSKIYALVADNKFPKPQRNLGKNLWRESALIAWLDANDPNQED